MTLNENHIRELLEQATPGPWKHDDEVGEILGAYYEKNGIGYIPSVGYADDYNADLIALAPELAADWLRMRSDLGHLARILEDFAASPDSAPADKFAAQQIHKLLNGVTND